jgi:hypothetical protein
LSERVLSVERGDDPRWLTNPRQTTQRHVQGARHDRRRKQRRLLVGFVGIDSQFRSELRRHVSSSAR